MLLSFICPMPASTAVPAQKTVRRARLTLLAVFLCCALPIAFAVYAYVAKPFSQTSNYGTLLSPQVPVPATAFTTLAGVPFNMQQLQGRWVLISAIHSSCGVPCQTMLFYQRQARATKGKEQGRIERVVFVLDDGTLNPKLIEQFPGVHFVRAQPAQLQPWLPLVGGIHGKHSAADVGALTDHVFVADPLGHVMMRFPSHAQLQFERFRKDISRLLWASNIG